MIKTKFPFWFWGKLPLNLAWEATLLYKNRFFYDGITFFELVVNTDFYETDPGDFFINHNPKLEFRLIVLNVTIFELIVYSTK